MTQFAYWPPGGRDASRSQVIVRSKHWRGLVMRTDKLATVYQAALHLAAILIWLREQSVSTSELRCGR
ncbi:hypothetical protein KY5_7748 [Streptomyces formicae]|uniref:Mobile element protein n=1 Tax=Streptomyces formicae TaxID=1616117 RepID=A0A291QMM2_9ACTN|nr:hypothetical protein KY5_7748 [Streptomyces formicae]